jgi:hypothetical protein
VVAGDSAVDHHAAAQAFTEVQTGASSPALRVLVGALGAGRPVDVVVRGIRRVSAPGPMD